MSLTLILGGIRSGKSRYAEALCRGYDRPVTYLAPGRPPSADDPEWAARVLAHRAGRPPTWTTRETRDLVGVLADGAEPVLIDCLGTWLTGLVDDADGWDDLASARGVVAAAREDLVRALARHRGGREIVVVSNEVGWSLVPMDPSGRFFADELGRLNAACAAAADRVALVVAGRVLDLTTAPVVP